MPTNSMICAYSCREKLSPVRKVTVHTNISELFGVMEYKIIEQKHVSSRELPQAHAGHIVSENLDKQTCGPMPPHFLFQSPQRPRAAGQQCQAGLGTFSTQVSENACKHCLSSCIRNVRRGSFSH